MPTASVRHLGSRTKDYKKSLDKLKDDYQRRMKEETANAPQTQREEENNNTVMAVIKRGDDTQDRTN